MTNPQTEARAIVAPWVHPFGITPDEEAEIVSDIATALAAKDAELADLREQNERQEATIVRFNSRAERAEAQLKLEIATREFWQKADATSQAQLAEANEALERALAERAGGATHRHKKRGTEYVLIGYGKMQTEAWFEHDGSAEDDLSVDMRAVAIYRSVDDGSLWVRPREEFEDGRFEALTAALAQEGK